MTAFRKGDYMGMAEAWLRGRDVRRFGGSWWRWRDGAYRRVCDESVKGSAWRWMGTVSVESRGGSEPLLPNRNRVANLLSAARALRHVAHPGQSTTEDGALLASIVGRSHSPEEADPAWSWPPVADVDDPDEVARAVAERLTDGGSSPWSDAAS